MELTINVIVPRDILESVFVTALEGGSNYWYWITDKNVDRIRESVSKEQEKYFSIAMFKAIYDNKVDVDIYDRENEELCGTISMTTMRDRLQALADGSCREHLIKVLDEDFDAENADVVFQYLTMGEVVYG
jgi:hypothetical protein